MTVQERALFVRVASGVAWPRPALGSAAAAPGLGGGLALLALLGAVCAVRRARRRRRDASSLLASPAVGSDAVSGTADGTVGRGTWELAPVPVPE